MTSDGRPWFETAFQAAYLDVYPHRDLASARLEVRGLVERGVRGRVLDLGCGFGRHALALSEHGVWVTGLDLSLDLLRHADTFLRGVKSGGEVRPEARLVGRLVRGDFRNLPFGERSFDALLMLFSSFGYFDDAHNSRVLEESARVLAPGGIMVLDLMNAERVRKSLVPQSRREHAGGVLEERRRLIEGGRRVRKDVVLTDPKGFVRHWHEDVRLFEPDELVEICLAHGLEVDRFEGDFDGREMGPDAPRRILWARRS